MNSALHASYSKKALFFLLAVLRFFLVAAALTMIAIEFAETYLQKDVLHLALFSMFFLICNFQINLSRHKDVMKSEDRIGRLFILALFSLSAAFLELVDLGFDQLLSRFRGNVDLISWYQSICVFEVIFGIIAICMLTYSLDRMLVSLRSIASDYKTTSLWLFESLSVLNDVYSLIHPLAEFVHSPRHI